jgi:hypothetical protein
MSVVWESFRQTILEPIYLAENTANDQQVAILFITLALAVLADPRQPMFHPEAQRYYQLSRASISLGEVATLLSKSMAHANHLPVTGYISIPLTICYRIFGMLVLHTPLCRLLTFVQQLFANYNTATNDPDGSNKAWGASSLAIRLAQMV